MKKLNATILFRLSRMMRKVNNAPVVLMLAIIIPWAELNKCYAL